VDRPVTVREGLTATADLVARELPPVVGRVVDLKTGDPVPKALIVFVTDREHIIATDEEGRFRIEGDCLPSFVVRADGYAESTLFVDPERAEEQPVLARLIPGGRIYGRVVDEAGNPVASARIRALVDPERVAATIPGPLTDEEGRFAFTWVRLPPNGAQVVVLAEGAEMNPAAADAVHLLPGGAIEHVTLTLMKPIEVSLRLVDERGVPWPRAEVNLEWREGPPPGPVHDFVAANPRSFSDGEGRVRVTGLRRGLHKLIVGAHRRLPWSTDVRIEGRPGEDLGDVLLPRGLALAGRVESTGGEEVPQGTTLHLAGRAGQSLSIDIEPDGSFLFEGFEPGNYVLRGEAPAHESTRIRVAAGQRDIVLRLRAFGSLHLTLAKQVGTAEGMVELTGLTGTARHREPYRREFADIAKPVLFPRLEAGSYRVRVAAGDEYAHGKAMVKPGPPSELTLDLKRGATVEGRLRAANGEPVPGVGVKYDSGGGWGVVARVTDAQGGFRFTGIPPGEIKVASHPVGYPPAEKTVRVAAGETISCDLELRLGGKLRIRVHGSDGNPVTGAAVALTGADGEAVRFWVEGGQVARTNADGELLLSGIPAGTHRLVVALGGKRTEPKEIQVVEGEVRDVPVVLDR
jgi:protocatechuate 3,4-dioxygenase beta subunit